MAYVETEKMKQVTKKKKRVESEFIAKVENLERLRDEAMRRAVKLVEIADNYQARIDRLCEVVSFHQTRTRAERFRNLTPGKPTTVNTNSKAGKVVQLPQRTKPVRYEDVSTRVFLDRAAKE